MTANELADKLDLIRIELTIQASAMLRQQDKEIEELKKIVEGTIGQAFYEDDYHKAKAEIESLKQKLELAEWDEETWKKFKKDNYEVIELKPRSEK